MQYSFREIFVKDILKNKILIISALVITVLGFGFTITNFSIGVDDPAAYHYLYTNGWGSLIQQGRLLHVLFSRLTGALTFIPFLNDFIGAALFFLSALLFCGLFQYVTNSRLSTAALTVFSGIYLSFSIISDKFIYNLDVIVTMLSYVCVACALIFAYQFVYLQQKKAFLPAVAVLILGVGAYESFIFLYICGVFAVFMLKCIVGQKKLTLKNTLIRGLLFLLILVLAVLCYYSAVFLVQTITQQTEGFVRNSIWNNSASFVDTGTTICKSFLTSMLDFSYLPMLEFTLFSVLGFVLSIGYAVKRKAALLPICFLGLFAANFGIHFVVGYIMYRAGQTFCLFVGFVAMLAVYSLRNMKPAKALIPILAGWLIFVQLADLNMAFYHDYSRYKKEEFVINTVATRLVAECDVNKPVVFTNRPSGGYLNSPVVGQVNGNSMMYWGVRAFGDVQSSTMLELFRMHGYYFLQTPTVEQAERGAELSGEMEAWPSDGCIKEFEDIIVVNFGVKN